MVSHIASAWGKSRLHAMTRARAMRPAASSGDNVKYLRNSPIDWSNSLRQPRSVATRKIACADVESRRRTWLYERSASSYLADANASSPAAIRSGSRGSPCARAMDGASAASTRPAPRMSARMLVRGRASTIVVRTGPPACIFGISSVIIAWEHWRWGLAGVMDLDEKIGLLMSLAAADREG